MNCLADPVLVLLGAFLGCHVCLISLDVIFFPLSEAMWILIPVVCFILPVCVLLKARVQTWRQDYEIYFQATEQIIKKEEMETKRKSNSTKKSNYCSKKNKNITSVIFFKHPLKKANLEQQKNVIFLQMLAFNCNSFSSWIWTEI